MSTAQIAAASPLGVAALAASAGPIREMLLRRITAAVDGLYRVPAPDDERDLPVTIVQDAADEVDTAYGMHRIAMPVSIARAQAALDTDASALRTQAHEALAGIVREVYADETFRGLADGVDYVGGGIQTELGKFVFAEASFRVRYHHARGNPFVLDEPQE
jgi:hypothetical protein